jgi:POT family proton-dependent oligopeptide transporter
MTATRRQLFTHPLGLAVLFSTELWERFSFYGMRALLIFYLTQHFLFSDSQAYLVYGAYMALVFGSPLIGGFIGDRVLGCRRAVLLGGVLLVAGHLGLSLELGTGAVATVVDGLAQVHRNALSMNTFYGSLALLIAGVGLLKPNIAALVGQLYGPAEPRREAGFVLFYMSINIGGALAALICGYLAKRYGWQAGFGAAAVGMLFGLVVFLKGQRFLISPEGRGFKAATEGPTVRGIATRSAGVAAFLILAFWLVQRPAWVAGVLTVCALLVTGWLIHTALRAGVSERSRLFSCTALILFAVCFWVVYEQGGSSINLFTDRFVDRNAFGTTIAAPQLQAINPILVLVFGPLLGSLWTVLAFRGVNPSAPAKFAFALLLVGTGFVILSIAISHLAAGQLLPIGWLVLLYLFMSIAELCIAPIGLSALTSWAPPGLTGTLVGAWYLAYGSGSFLAAVAAAYAQPTSLGSANGTAYGTLYSRLGILALVAGGLLCLLTPLIRRGIAASRATNAAECAEA